MFTAQFGDRLRECSCHVSLVIVAAATIRACRNAATSVYGNELKALDKVSVDIRRDEFVAIVGPLLY